MENKGSPGLVWKGAGLTISYLLFILSCGPSLPFLLSSFPLALFPLLFFLLSLPATAGKPIAGKPDPGPECASSLPTHPDA